MSVGPLGILGSAAGSPLPQAKGANVEATQQATTEQARRTDALRTAEAAEGLGEMDQDQEAEDRDADGRRPWDAARCSLPPPSPPPTRTRLQPSPTQPASAARGSTSPAEPSNCKKWSAVRLGSDADRVNHASGVII